MKFTKGWRNILAISLALLAILLLFDRLDSGTIATGFAVYETQKVTWYFDTESGFSFDSSLIGLSGGEAKLKLATTIGETTDSLSATLPKGSNSELSISGLSDSKYKTALLNAGDEYYADKKLRITAIPAELQGMLWIKTQQADYNSKKNVSFTTNRPVRLFVGYDKRKETAPDWLQDWAYWGEGVTTEDDKATPFKLYYKDFAAGSITLGSNNKSKAMYAILLNNTGYAGSYSYISPAKGYAGKLKTVKLAADKPDGTSIKVQIRASQAQQELDAAEWLGPTSASDYYTGSEEAVNSAHGSNGGWLQYRATLETADPASTPALNSVTITTEKTSYAESAAITTADYEFGKLAEIQQISADETINSQETSYAYSTDSGSSWTTTALNTAISAKAAKIRLKASLSSNTTATPVIRSLTATFRISVCDENWQPGYTSCSKEDAKTRHYTDANGCGSAEDLPADNGTAESCDYCTPAWIETNGSCRNDDAFSVSYAYANSCCQETGLAADCTMPQNTTAVCDYCIPAWTETNGSCSSNDTITATFSDASSCYAQTGLAADNNRPASKTHSCDYCTPSFLCSSYSECGTDDKKICAQANDSNSCYAKTGLAADSYSGNYSEFSTACAYDNEKPKISNATAAVANSALAITAKITDKSEVTATAIVIKDSAAVMNITLTNTTATDFSGIAAATGLKGAYIVAIVAKDSYNNTARAKGAAGFAIHSENAAAMEFALNGTRKAILKLTNKTQVELSGKATTDMRGVSLILSEHATDLRNTTKPAGRRELQRYVEIEAEEEVKSNISLAIIRANYSDADIAAANTSEASLAMYFYNETVLLWQQINSTVNAALNYVEGNTTHLSIFGIFGAEQNETIPANTTANETANSTSTPAANLTNQTASEQQQPQSTAQAAPEGGAANTSGAAGNNAGNIQVSSIQEKTEEKPNAEKSKEPCTHSVNVALQGKPSFINTSEINATLTNTGTCELKNIEIKATLPLDSYITIEDGKKAALTAAESASFSIRLKAAYSSGQKQPFQGFAVKEPGKIASHSGKIIITGRSVEGLEIESISLTEEVPLNIEVYEVEQKSGGKGAIILIGTLIFVGLLAAGYGVAKRKKNKENERGSENSEAPKESNGKSQSRQDEEKQKFGDSLKNFEEKLPLPEKNQLKESEKEQETKIV